MDVSLTTARDQLPELVDQASHTHQPVILTNDGQPVGALISADDLKHFQDLEDAADIALCEQVKRESKGTITHAELEALVEAWENEA